MRCCEECGSILYPDEDDLCEWCEVNLDPAWQAVYEEDDEWFEEYDT